MTSGWDKIWPQPNSMNLRHWQDRWFLNSYRHFPKTELNHPNLNTRNRILKCVIIKRRHVVSPENVFNDNEMGMSILVSLRVQR